MVIRGGNRSDTVSAKKAAVAPKAAGSRNRAVKYTPLRSRDRGRDHCR